MEVKTYSYILNIVLIILVIVGTYLYMQLNVDKKQDYTAILEYNENEKNQLIQSNNLLVEEVKTMNQNIVSSDLEIKKLSKDFEDYKKITSYTKAEIISEVRNIKIPYITVDKPIYLLDTGCIDVKVVKENFIQVPSKLQYDDEWFKFNATLGLDKLVLDSMSMINKFDVTIGEKKVGKKMLVFNKYEPTVELKSYNPYSSVPYMNNIVVEERKGSIRRKALGYAIVFGLGIATNKLISN